MNETPKDGVGVGFEPARWIELKTDPAPWYAVESGRKTFEIRFNDRNYQPGDGLLLRRTRYTGADMKAGKPLEYLGEPLRRVVTHVMTGPLYGLSEGWAILSIAPCGVEEAHAPGEIIGWQWRRTGQQWPEKLLHSEPALTAPDTEKRAIYAGPTVTYGVGVVPALTRCAADRDGDCTDPQCPQLRDGEPKATGRHCPLDARHAGVGEVGRG